MQTLTNRYIETAKNELLEIQTSLSSRFAGDELTCKTAIEYIPIYKRENEAYRKRAEHRLECEGTVLTSLVLLPPGPALLEVVYYHHGNCKLIDSVIDQTLEYDKYADRSLAFFKEHLARLPGIKRDRALHMIKRQELIFEKTNASYYRLKTRLAAMRFWPVTDRNTARIAFCTNAFERLVCERELANSRIAGYCVCL
jgi:hypothetical protein